MKPFDAALYKERVNAFPFFRLMGMTVLSVGDGRSVLRLRSRNILRNSGGILHGGVMGVLVDTAMAAALRSVLPPSMRMSTVEYKVNFLKPVLEGSVTAHATVLRLGRRIAFGSADVRNDAGESVAFGSVTFYLVSDRETDAPPAVPSAPPAIMKKKARGVRRKK